jgi:hypothetical protein
LEYLTGDPPGVVQATIAAPAVSGVDQDYIVSYAVGTDIPMTSGQKLGLRATAGSIAGVWDPVVITLTITP